MTISHLLDDFGAFAAGTPMSISDVSLEEQRLEAFEKGYQAGWDDSAKAQEEGGQKVSADLAQNLHELSFTYQEAYSAMLKSLSPLLQQMVEVVLPKAAHITMGARLTEMLHDLAKENGNSPVEIATSASDEPTIEDIIPSDLPMPVTVSSDPSVAEGQVYIRIGSTERAIDMSEVLAEMERLVTGFYEENQKEIA